MNEKNSSRATLSVADLEQDISNEPMGKKKAKGLHPLVNITVTSYRKRKHDPDGISVKAVLDGLVRRGLLQDDSTEEINKVTFSSVITTAEEKTIIEIEEITA